MTFKTNPISHPQSSPNTTRLRLELFVQSLPESQDFYTRILGFEPVSSQPGGYSVFCLENIQIALQVQSQLPDDHPLKPQAHERAGLGIEIVLEVIDLDAAYARVLQQDWPIAGSLTQRPWGTRDFRILDPNGYYLRINQLTPLPNQRLET